jgi:hypothetical protein
VPLYAYYPSPFTAGGPESGASLSHESRSHEEKVGEISGGRITKFRCKGMELYSGILDSGDFLNFRFRNVLPAFHIM